MKKKKRKDLPGSCSAGKLSTDGFPSGNIKYSFVMS